MKIYGKKNIRDIMKVNRTFCIRLSLAVAILVWCLLIFFMSAETADLSGDRSEGISRRIINAFVEIFKLEAEDKEASIQFFEHLLRKAAHVFAYFVLSFLSLMLAFTYECKEYVRILSSSVFCLIYAQSDEIHQIFVPGRAGSMKDVLIDMSGVLISVLLVYLIKAIITLRKRKKDPEK